MSRAAYLAFSCAISASGIGVNARPIEQQDSSTAMLRMPTIIADTGSDSE